MTSKPEGLLANLRTGLEQLPYLPRALSLVWEAAHGWTLAWVVMLIIQGLLPVATVYLARAVVDSLVEAVEAAGALESIRPLMVLVGLMAGVLLAAELLRGASSWIRIAQSEGVHDHVMDLIHRKCAQVDLSFYETPEYHDRLHRARVEARYRPVSLLESGGALVQSAITLVAMLAVLAPYGLWLPFVLLAGTLPALYVVLRHNMRRHEWRLRATPDERRAWYYDWLLTAAQTAAEVRLFRLGRHFQTAFQEVRRRLRKQRLSLARDQGLAQAQAGLVALLVMGGAMAWMVWQAIQGLVTLGDLALFYQALRQGQSGTRSLLENMGGFFANVLFLGDLFEFLALEPRVIDPASPSAPPARLHGAIRFEKVSFCYPGGKRMALDEFNLRIPAGEIAAVVGPNGAGKSTVIKLLCRFYDPGIGRVTLDGIDLRCFRIEDLHRQITLLFEEPVHYSTTVAENIALGDLTVEHTKAEIEAAAETAGADKIINRLPRGYQTILGKWFSGGTELSRGEWQRLALARAFLRQAPIIALDEPTSAMDSWAEAEWMDRFRDLADGRTALIVTHRFTTAMKADVIHVMDQGRIVESGTHEELLALDGLYARSWMAQHLGAIPCELSALGQKPSALSGRSRQS